CPLLTAQHGEVQRIAQHIRNSRAQSGRPGGPAPFPHCFSQTNIVNLLIATLESLCKREITEVGTTLRAVRARSMSDELANDADGAALRSQSYGESDETKV